MRVAVTGANGFVGRSLIEALIKRSHSVRALVRHPDPDLAAYPIETIATGAIENIEDWRPYLTGIDTVVHLAARAHLGDSDMLDMKKVRAINTDATLNLARSAAKRKVIHFIYLSSITVHGERNQGLETFSATSLLDPKTAYARSKADAERGLQDLQAQGAMGITVVRPPLIYGSGARGNFRDLCRLVARAPFLPFASVTTLRTLLDVDNLGDALCRVVEHPQTGFSAYTLGDDDALSFAELVRLIAAGLDKPVKLIPAPIALLRLVGILGGRSDLIQKIIAPAVIDSGAFKKVFAWAPPHKAHAHIQKAASAYRLTNNVNETLP